MASNQSRVDYACEQMRGAGTIRQAKMFGEYAIYCDEKLVALVCDNQVFVKPTLAGREMIAEPTEGPPYPGAKPMLIVDEYLDNAEWLAKFIAVTVQALPIPKPKKIKSCNDQSG